MSTPRTKNPFGITKAVDLNDSQIQSLWVDVAGIDEEFEQFSRPSSPMPTFVLGAKGSGKTHLMRYHSFELQVLRYLNDASIANEVQVGVQRDGYIGIYVLCGSINSNRFNGKRQSEEKWREVFAYYLELWLTHHLLHIVNKLGVLQDSEDTDLTKAILKLFDKPPEPTPSTFVDLVEAVSKLQRELDYKVNNAVMLGTLSVEILATRGKLIFGIPKLLSERYAFLKDVLFVYSIDEFENLTVEQQKVVNSLVRDRTIPATLRVGARLYGVKTRTTDGLEEENLRDSEYEVLELDRIFRTHKKQYASFAKSLVLKRLVEAGVATPSIAEESDANVHLGTLFEAVDDAWNSEHFLALMKDRPTRERVHFKDLLTRLAALGTDDSTNICSVLSCSEFPLLEKVNILLFNQRLQKDKPAAGVARDVARECSSFLENLSSKSKYAEVLSHYKSDLVAQLNRDNNFRHNYTGLDTFIAMSAGLPRALLTILRSVFEWSTFNGENPLGTGKISLDAQTRGVKEASDWFYENMRKAGEDGRTIQAAITRLAEIFRINRFSEKPVECSLSTFIVPQDDVSPEAMRILALAEDRSFLVRIAGGGKDKNSGSARSKFQLTPMLAPRWDLPLARRGAVSFTPSEFNAIFDAGSGLFSKVSEEWRARTSANIGTKRISENLATKVQGSLL